MRRALPLRKSAAAAAVAAALWGTAPGIAAADDFPGIARARAALEQAAGALEAARSGEATLAALGQAVTAHEAALAAYRDALRSMAARESRLRSELQKDSARMEEVVVALQSLARAPRSALLVFPQGPVGAARGAGLMASVSPHLHGRIEDLRGRIEALERLRTGQEVARVEARGALAALQELRADSDEALRRRKNDGLPKRAELAEQAAAAAGQARDLDALALALRDAADQGRDALVTFSEARGLVPPPVEGVMTAGFGEPDPWGRPGRGVTLSAPAWAQVSAPWDGTVRFAGPLIDYGNVVVLEPEEGTLIVLAGLATSDRLVGETVLAGERLGDLGGPVPASGEFLLKATTDRDEIGAEKLYIEVRRAGQPVDPAFWFNLAKQGTDG